MAGSTNNYGTRIQSQPDLSMNEGTKRRNTNDEKETNILGPDDTVYRYLCPARKIGSIIGIGGDIAKQLRAETHAKIRISETIPGCEERVVTIYSTSEETNKDEDNEDEDDESILISPAQHALFKVHDRIIADELPLEGEFDEVLNITVRLLVSSDQIGCVLGRGGQVVKNIRSETNAQIRILNSDHLPPCALSSDELIQISGEASDVKKALYQVAARLHENPSRSQHLLLSASSIYRSGSQNPGGPYIGNTSLMGSYGGYRMDGVDRSDYVKEFSLRLICPHENIGAVIGKGGSVIKQIRQESGAYIKVDVSNDEGDDCLIFVSAKEAPDDVSRTIDAIMRLQQRCSERNEKETGDITITTRILVPGPQIGCLIGKGGAIISEMRRSTRASIRIFSEENLPKVASEDDEMVQIIGDVNVASAALLQVLTRLRSNLFEMDRPLNGPRYGRSNENYNSYGGRKGNTRGVHSPNSDMPYNQDSHRNSPGY